MRTISLTVLMVTILTFALPGGLAADAHAAGAKKAPDFTGGGAWFNTGGKVLSITGLQGKVVAVKMWTAGCYNCLNVLPYIKQWDARYRDQGLVIVGVHSPEFSYERSEAYVQKAVAKLGIRFPVVMDNGFRIWRAYNNVYWPTLYLVDRKGTIRYKHIGEGAYEETEQMIKRLLNEST